MAAGAALFAVACAAVAIDTTSIVWLAPPFIAAGIAIVCAGTAEQAAVAALAPEHLCAARRSGCSPPLERQPGLLAGAALALRQALRREARGRRRC